MLVPNETPLEYQQGTPEWLELRKTKITATDAPVIMGDSPWKTPLQLYHEKTTDMAYKTPNAAMLRGIELEPIARELFTIQTGIYVEPKVVVNGIYMASLDGISADETIVVEIKCPGYMDHDLALNGEVPKHYYAQLQHQMLIAEVDTMYYFSFDGTDGTLVTVPRNQDYIDKMINEEMAFYQCIITKTPPEPSERDYIERDDQLWEQCASRWKNLNATIKELEKEEQEIRNQLIFLSGESNSKGAGISLCKIKRKGSVEYSQIPELKGVDLDKYRKESINTFRIISE